MVFVSTGIRQTKDLIAAGKCSHWLRSWLWPPEHDILSRDNQRPRLRQRESLFWIQSFKRATYLVSPDSRRQSSNLKENPNVLVSWDICKYRCSWVSSTKTNTSLWLGHWAAATDRRAFERLHERLSFSLYKKSKPNFESLVTQPDVGRSFDGIWPSLQLPFVLYSTTLPFRTMSQGITTYVIVINMYWTLQRTFVLIVSSGHPIMSVSQASCITRRLPLGLIKSHCRYMHTPISYKIITHRFENAANDTYLCIFCARFLGSIKHSFRVLVKTEYRSQTHWEGRDSLLQERRSSDVEYFLSASARRELTSNPNTSYGVH